MSIRERGEGRWMVDVQVERADGTTERDRKVFRGTKREAEAYERKMRTRLLDGPRDEERPEAPTVEEYAEQYVQECSVACGHKPSTIKSKRGMLRTWIVPVLGGRKMDDLRTADFTKLRTALAANKRSGARARAPGPKTINNVLLVLSSMVRWWHAEQDLPVPSFRTNLVKHEKRKTRAFYDFEPWERLVKAAGEISTEHLAILLLGGEAGLRMSEIRALHWGDFDIKEARSIVVVQRTREDDEELPAKSWEHRTVPLTRRLAAVVRDLPRHLRDPHVFLDESVPLTRKKIRTRLNQAQRRARLVESGFHITRHTFCSHLAMRGVPATTIQELAGHEDLSTTSRYMHLAPSALDAGIAALDERPRQHGGNALGGDKKTAS